MSQAGLWDKYRRLWALVPPTFKWAAIALVAGSVAGSVLEVLGIALLGVLLGELGSAGPASTGPLAALLGFLPDAADPQSRVYLIVALCAVVFLAKNLFLAAHAWAEATFAFRVQAWISHRLVGESLRLPYEQAVRRPPSEYTALLVSDLLTLVNHTLLPALALLSEAALVAGMFIFLVSMHTVPTLVIAGVLAGAGAFMAIASRRVVSHLGMRRQALEDSRMRSLQQTFTNLRDVHIYGAARQLEARLADEISELAGVYRGYLMMATGPRFLLEFAMVAILLAMIAIGVGTHQRGVLVATVGVFAASGFRFLIGANRIIMSMQSLRFGQAAFERVWDAIGTTAAASREPPARDEAQAEDGDWAELRARGLQYAHDGGAGVGPLDLYVRKGEMVGLVGRSGVGKSTVLELLAGLRHPRAGKVELVDAHGHARAVTAPSPRITLVGQNSAVFATTLRENVAFGLEPQAVEDEALWAALRLAQLQPFARGLSRQLDTPLTEFGASLSGGQQQRIGIARALCRHSSFMLLDEPTSALDPATEEELVRTLRQLTDRCGILLVSHRKAPLEQCDRVYEVHPDGIRLVRAAASADLAA